MARGSFRSDFCARLWLGSVAICAIGLTAPVLHAASLNEDSRAVKLADFFKEHHCPQPYLISEYLRAADKYRIDYRLLPAVSVRESTCGMHARWNNRWGWDSARTGFESLARGIEFIARQLAQGRPYRGKSLDQKLHTYNPNPYYAKEVLQLMRDIDSD